MSKRVPAALKNIHTRANIPISCECHRERERALGPGGGERGGGGGRRVGGAVGQL